MVGSGFVFVEMYTQSTPEYISFFQRVAGFELKRHEGDFTELRSQFGVVLLNADRNLPPGHPFSGKLHGQDQGIGVEIGVVLPDLTAAREAALSFPGWTVTEIINQDWGMADFRVITPDGYYIRLTEAFD